MARSPFQGTFQDGIRPVVAHAPDAFVKINGEVDILGCNSCRRRFPFNRYITDISIDLSVDNAPGSASFNLSIPRHSVDDFFVDGSPLITEMMEIEIYSKGYYLVEGVPQYYPSFWGLVTEVSENYSGGVHTVSVSCSDILKWWELCKMNVTSAFTDPGGQLGRDYIYGNLFEANVYDVIWTLAQQSFGDVVSATGSLVSSMREKSQGPSFQAAMGDIINYWTQRFKQMRSNLLLYGVQGAAVRGDILYDTTLTKTGGIDSKWASKAVRKANGGDDTSQLLFNPDDVIPFRSNLANAGQPNLWQSEYQSKLELANACKEAVGYEFYMDVTGDIVFKPPFYNLDILSNKPVSWIQDIDVIDYNISSSESELVTHLQMQGSFEGGAMDMGVTSDFNTPFVQVIDYHLLRQVGTRTQTYNAEYLRDNDALFYFGLDLLDRINSKRHRATVKIPFRPELRLGFPVYLATKDQIWYIKGINHSITFGGSATTSLTLSARRSKYIAPRGIGTLDLTGFKNSDKGGTTTPLQKGARPTNAQLSNSGAFKMKIGEAAQIPNMRPASTSVDSDPYAPLLLKHPKTGRVVGYPNAVLTYTQPFDPSPEALRNMMGEKTPGKDKRAAKKIIKKDSRTASDTNLSIQQNSLTQTPERDLVDRHLSNRYFFGMTSAGVYTYTRDTSQVIQELLLLPAKNIDVTIAGADGVALDPSRLLGKTATIRPISDERGFELIGHYRYGRGVALRDGSLVLSEKGGKNERARVDTQVALAGGLHETLIAQSQGLTVLTSSYTDPATALSTLQPEDLQTAGVINPETGVPKFTNAETSFIDTAPLNSPENTGLPPNVEVSLLSKALTLAELAPIDDTAASFTNCHCMTSRSDLAFINVGYQVKLLSGSAPDNTNLATSAGGTGKFGTEVSTAAAQAEVDRLTTEVDVFKKDPILPSEPALQEQLASLEAQLAKAQENLAASQKTVSQFDAAGAIIDDSGSAARPVMGGGTVMPANQVMSAVEKYLSDLYEVLDAPHQEYEKALRGNTIPGPTRQQIMEGTYNPQGRFGALSPPFSPIGRARGGDVQALAKQGETSIDNMGIAWKRFGENLQNNTEKAALQTEVTQLNTKIQALEREQETLLKALGTGSTTISPDGSIDERLKKIEADKAEAIQDRDNALGKIQDINNSTAQGSNEVQN